MQHDGRAARANGVHFDRRRRHGHHYFCFDTEGLSCQCDALGMITCRSSNDAGLTRLGAEATHFVVGATALERKNGLQILSLQQDLIAEP